MSLSEHFSATNFNPGTTGPKKRPAPFSLRLSPDERARLAVEAAGAPLSTYIKAKVLGDAPPLRLRRSGLAVEDRQALAKALALLGRSRLSSNLNQLAHLANVGALPVTPETEAELTEALAEIREIRRLVMVALGLKPGGSP
ncbi:MobC domain-containing protein [Belnapia rosea]|uniref:Mobilisation protein (MobC) n=1 Tax=Belnapia rosea TaxID=938405 RepID=A0A1G6SXP4_9PROT|nr:plasmid mobilization relaxosome protein MobC [Belnapia rosea]SDD21608.1 mobilisation protein (MobC) [Belnapia rosea]